MKKVNIGSVKIIPLGGLEQIGMNITAIQYDDSIIVVDCGLSFPEEEMLGIDLVIPDVTFLKQNLDKVKGFVITHGHEDHIGAIPYLLKNCKPFSDLIRWIQQTNLLLPSVSQNSYASTSFMLPVR